ncbi:putative programmed cell death 6-interacting protein isoform X2 [Apostichopus japonicus]|uniref:Putative programmed cell death 6-interacting protein isoform X2 n=1 Tax=Stichopus japonicus TaxID=307972 RepID=A0A2G8KFT6_STIJA|nr:putative programmed cell death 6-interacting protein isoform X2 [Apostichopus japonicus]
MKDAIISKVASAASDLYTEALNAMQLDEVSLNLPKEWVPIVAGKQALMHAYSEYHQALVCRSGKNQAVGRKYHKELTAAKKDNELIYSDIVPEVSNLKSPGSAVIAKILDVQSQMTENFTDLFEKLVPLSIHNAMVAYENRKAGIVNQERACSLNLPAAVEDLGGDTILNRSSKNLNSCKRVETGIIDKLFSDLPELLERNRAILSEAMKDLDNEATADREMKEKFKEKWSRTPSEQLQAAFRSEGNKYKQILDNAIQADHVVKEKYTLTEST